MQSSFETVIQFACSDVAKALATYAYVESLDEHLRANVVYTLRFLGVQDIEAEDLYRKLDELLQGYLRTGSYDEERRRREELRRALHDCFGKLGVLGESRRRIKGLTEEELRLLSVAALGIVKKEYWKESFDSNYVATFVSAMLSKDISYEYLERLFVKTLLAVRSHWESRRYYRYIMTLIPGSLELIRELARSVESEYPSYDYIYSKLKNVKPYQIAALLQPNREFYKAIYGYDVREVLESLVIEKIVYRGAVNEYIRDELRNVVKSLTQEHCYRLTAGILENALRSVGYEVNLDQVKFSEPGYCCRYTAVKLDLPIYIYVQPFAISPCYVGEYERAIIVVGGTGASIPEYLKRLKESPQDYYEARLATRLVKALWVAVYKHGIHVFESTVREDWQREIAEALRRIPPSVAGTVDVVVEKPLATVAQPTTGTVATTPSPIATIQASEILESIVAQALRALGFIVQTNARKAARRGAPVEVDVWAEKAVGDSRFRVYVSCKNWDRDVDRPVVDEEFGRVLNLQEVPHLRILVVKSMSRTARDVAEADGFFVIELGEEATKANVREMYDHIYRKLSELFTSIAPPQLLEIARKVSQTAEELNKIAQELAKLSQSYTTSS